MSRDARAVIAFVLAFCAGLVWLNTPDWLAPYVGGYGDNWLFLLVAIFGGYGLWQAWLFLKERKADR